MTLNRTLKKGGDFMAGSTYKIIELVGTSDSSWEEAAKSAVETAGGSLKDLRIAEATKLDSTIEIGKVTSFRARLNVPFKYHEENGR
jgi:flavin-binding protein dodecin